MTLNSLGINTTKTPRQHFGTSMCLFQQSTIHMTAAWCFTARKALRAVSNKKLNMLLDSNLILIFLIWLRIVFFLLSLKRLLLSTESNTPKKTRVTLLSEHYRTNATILPELMNHWTKHCRNNLPIKMEF